MLIVFFLLVMILSILFTIEPTNFKNSYLRISEKHEQNSMNLTNAFGFIGLFSHYVVFGEIKWLRALKYAKKHVTKPKSVSMSLLLTAIKYSI